jgi:2-methylisocitrate lyase-like PEP mutase family enzyme
MAGKSVISLEEMVEKIHAAREARVDSDFVIKARTDAAGVYGIDEAIRRLQAYEAAGADHVVADALVATDHISAVVASVKLPVAVNMGFGIRSRSTTPLITAQRLEQMGVAVVTYPRLLTAAAMRGMDLALEALTANLNDPEPTERPDLVASFDQVNDLMQLGFLRGLETRFAVGGDASDGGP